MSAQADDSFPDPRQEAEREVSLMYVGGWTVFVFGLIVGQFQQDKEAALRCEAKWQDTIALFVEKIATQAGYAVVACDDTHQ